MKNLLESIIKECSAKGITAKVDGERNGNLAYEVMGFSKSGSAKIYIEDSAIVCETRYGRKDHILDFNDLVVVAYGWYLDYKDREPFNEPDAEWKDVFNDFTNRSGSGYKGYNEDLPF